jgi:hypothetical protein
MNSKLVLCLAVALGGGVVGCATHRDDARLQGTWKLNRTATSAVSSNVPSRVTWVTYSHGAVLVVGDEAQFGASNVAFHYHVIEHGSNYVVIRTTAPQDKRRRIHVRFIDADKGYWIDNGPLGYGIWERFDKFAPQADAKPVPPGMGGLIEPPPIQIDQW